MPAEVDRLTPLTLALSRLRACGDDLRDMPSEHASGALKLLLAELDAEPLRGVLATLPEFDLARWWKQCAPAGGYNMGPVSLEFPLEIREGIACRLLICRDAAASPRGFQDFAYSFIGMRDDYDTRFRKFARLVVDPLIRDVEYLTTLRQAPPVLDQLVARVFPSTGDQDLDAMLEESRQKFQDPSAVIRKEALERLWDAWERLKTLLNPGNKEDSVRLLLDKAASTAAFRVVLEQEASTLTKLGNDFHIRHFEMNRNKLDASSEVDYLFHRMAALIWLILTQFAASQERG